MDGGECVCVSQYVWVRKKSAYLVTGNVIFSITIIYWTEETLVTTYNSNLTLSSYCIPVNSVMVSLLLSSYAKTIDMITILRCLLMNQPFYADSTNANTPTNGLELRRLWCYPIFQSYTRPTPHINLCCVLLFSHYCIGTRKEMPVIWIG